MNWSIKKIIKYIAYFFSGIIFALLFDNTSVVKLLTLSFSHVILIFYLISFVSFLYNLFFFKDNQSYREVFKIYITLVDLFIIFIFFLLGNDIMVRNSFLHKIIIKINSSWIFINSISIMAITFFILSLDFLSAKRNKNNEIPKLYKSREPLLDILNEYLRTMNSFSITGNWGIGKTVLIRNFFYSNNYSFKDNYELIYIDSSIYSNNKNIIEKLQNEIDILLEKYNIIKNKNTITEEIFLENNNFLKSLYKLIFPQKSSYEIRESLESKFNSINKQIVLCLDNLERNGDCSQIIKLFAIISELLPKNIKIIYIYDEDEMNKIFDRDSKNFIEYISKYTFNKIEVKDSEVEEVLELCNLDIKNIFEEIYNKISSSNLVANSIKLLEDKISDKYYEGIDEFIENIKKNFEKIKEDILEKLKNPRYVENLISYLKTGEEIDLKYKFEYKITRDFFPNICLESMGKTSYFSVLNLTSFKLVFSQKKEDISNRKLSVNQIEELFFIFLFKVDSNGNSYKYVAEQNIYFEKFFFSYKNKENTSFYKKIEDLKKDEKKNFIKILEIIHTLEPTNFCNKVQEYLTLKEDTNYIISTDDELRRLILLQGLEEISHLILPHISIDKNGRYADGSQKMECEDYLDIVIKIYIFNSCYILNLLQLNLLFDVFKEYFKKPIGLFSIVLKEQFKIEDENWLELFLKQLNLTLEKNKKTIKELNNYENTKKSIETLEKIGNLKSQIKEISSKKEKINIPDNFFSKQNKYQILNSIIIANNNFIINNKQYFVEIKINSKNIDDYINYLKLKLKTTQDKENIEFLLIQLIKFKNILGGKNGDFINIR